MCTAPDITGVWYTALCQKASMGAGGSYNLPDMGDWNRYEYNAVRSVKYRMQGVSKFYQWSNWGGTVRYSRPWDWYTWTYTADESPRSFALQN